MEQMNCSEKKEDRAVIFTQHDFAALMDKVGELRSALYEGNFGDPKAACAKANVILGQAVEILYNGIISDNA